MRAKFGVAALMALAGVSVACPMSAAYAASPAMVIQADTVLGFKCILNNRFHHGQPIVWRIRIIDTKTGEALGPKAMKSVMIDLPNGMSLPAHFGKHPPTKPVDYYWTFSWIVPAKFPTGSFSYKVVATNQAGQTATFVPFKAAPSQLTVVADKE